MRAVVITGVSRGLGAALFARLNAQDTRVLAIGRRFSPEQQAVAASAPDRVRLLTVDLARLDDSALLGLRDACAGVFAGATSGVLLLNAGVIEPIGAVETLRVADIAAAVAVNLTAPMAVTGAFLAARPAGLPATILFISSGAVQRPIEGWSVYSAAKAGGEMYFRVVAAEHPDLRVHCVHPGRIDTGMQAVLRRSSFPEAAEFVEVYERGELPGPEEVAGRIVSEYLTGQ
jgi:NAD(P)-dependent dehydrogenase (short-subunit alcohol dehydrogenase family)